MTDYEIQGPARVCAATGRELKPGDPFHAVLVEQEGKLVRTDYAVDAWTGQPTWGVRYPSRGPLLSDSQPSPRDLAPCVYADGCVFAAPLDTDRLFCIDAVSGEVRWELEGIEITHLLGVARERVYVATRKGVQAIGVNTGRAAWAAQPSEGRLPSLGRGLLAGSWLYWPTTAAEKPKYRAVTLRDGQQEKADDQTSVLPERTVYDPTMFWRLPEGNAAFEIGRASCRERV